MVRGVVSGESLTSLSSCEGDICMLRGGGLSVSGILTGTGRAMGGVGAGGNMELE